jgi:DNA-binding MarR family transcriptional regulator
MKISLEKVFSILSENKLGLSALHALVLATAPGGIRMVDIAAATQKTTANVTGTVDRLEKLGYVQRMHGTQDRREVLVHATDSGKDLVSSCRDRLEQEQK